MKPHTWMWMLVVSLFAALAMPIGMAAQDNPSQNHKTQHRTYELIDKGTFGGPVHSLWTGGNSMSHTSQTLAQESSGNIETNNHDVRYKVVPIGVLPGKTTTYLTLLRAVNNTEHVTGYSYVYTGDYHSLFLTGQGFIWQSGKLKALPLLSGWPGAFGFGINDRDQVVGAANKLDDNGNIFQVAVLWDHGQPVNLGALDPNSFSAALDVNISGVIVGQNYNPGAGQTLPLVWYGGNLHQLPLLPGEANGVAEEINALGVIVGAQWSDTNQVSCIWYWNGTGYAAANLGTFGGNFSQGLGINTLGQAVGWSLYAGDEHGPGFLWDYRHGLQALSPLPGDTDAQGNNINDFGQIVGLSVFFTPEPTFPI